MIIINNNYIIYDNKLSLDLYLSVSTIYLLKSVMVQYTYTHLNLCMYECMYTAKTKLLFYWLVKI